MKKAVICAMLLLLTLCVCGCKHNHRNNTDPGEGFVSASAEDMPGPVRNAPVRVPENRQSGEALYFTIGYSALTDDEAFFQNVKSGLEDACSAAGIELLSSVCGGDVDKMRESWKSFCDQGADIIIDFNLNREAGSVLTKEIEESYHIPVISVDERYSYAYFFGVDNEQAGIILGEFAAQQIRELWGGKVDYLLQLYNENNGRLVMERNESVLVGLKKGGVKISDRNVEWISAVEPGKLLSTSYVQPLIIDYIQRHMDKDAHILVSFYNDDAAAEMVRG